MINKQRPSRDKTPATLHQPTQPSVQDQASPVQANAHTTLRRMASAPSATLSPADILALQRTIGNQRVQRLLAAQARGSDAIGSPIEIAPSVHRSHGSDAPASVEIGHAGLIQRAPEYLSPGKYKDHAIGPNVKLILLTPFLSKRRPNRLKFQIEGTEITFFHELSANSIGGIYYAADGTSVINDPRQLLPQQTITVENVGMPPMFGQVPMQPIDTHNEKEEIPDEQLMEMESKHVLTMPLPQQPPNLPIIQNITVPQQQSSIASLLGNEGLHELYTTVLQYYPEIDFLSLLKQATKTTDLSIPADMIEKYVINFGERDNTKLRSLPPQVQYWYCIAYQKFLGQWNMLPANFLSYKVLSKMAARQARAHFLGTIGEILIMVNAKETLKSSQYPSWVIPHPDGAGATGIDLVVVTMLGQEQFEIVCHEVKVNVTGDMRTYGYNKAQDNFSSLPVVYMHNYGPSGERRERKSASSDPLEGTLEDLLISIIQSAQQDIPKDSIIKQLKLNRASVKNNRNEVLSIKWKLSMIGPGKKGLALPNVEALPYDIEQGQWNTAPSWQDQSNTSNQVPNLGFQSAMSLVTPQPPPVRIKGVFQVGEDTFKTTGNPTGKPVKAPKAVIQSAERNEIHTGDYIIVNTAVFRVEILYYENIPFIAAVLLYQGLE